MRLRPNEISRHRHLLPEVLRHFFRRIYQGRSARSRLPSTLRAASCPCTDTRSSRIARGLFASQVKIGAIQAKEAAHSAGAPHDRTRGHGGARPARGGHSASARGCGEETKAPRARRETGCVYTRELRRRRCPAPESGSESERRRPEKKTRSRAPRARKGPAALAGIFAPPDPNPQIPHRRL